MAKITRKQVVKTIVFTVVGAAPGVIWFIMVGTVQPVVIASLCAFIGFALSLPGVSLGNVAAGTAGMIAAHNAPPSMKGEIMDAFVGEKDAAEDEDDDDAPKPPATTGG